MPLTMQPLLCLTVQQPHLSLIAQPPPSSSLLRPSLYLWCALKAGLGHLGARWHALHLLGARWRGPRLLGALRRWGSAFSLAVWMAPSSANPAPLSGSGLSTSPTSRSTSTTSESNAPPLLHHHRVWIRHFEHGSGLLPSPSSWRPHPPVDPVPLPLLSHNWAWIQRSSSAPSQSNLSNEMHGESRSASCAGNRLTGGLGNGIDCGLVDFFYWSTKARQAF